MTMTRAVVCFVVVVSQMATGKEGNLFLREFKRNELTEIVKSLKQFRFTSSEHS